MDTVAGITLVPIDRQTMELVWSDDGYPAHAAYRDYHRRTGMDHKPWANDGAPYDRERAAARVREDAADFVTRTRERAAEAPDALVVCALDTELLGHWWFEGPQWLAAVISECGRQGLELVQLDDALETTATVPAPGQLPVTTWGSQRDLSTWDGPRVREFAWRARRAELEVVALGPGATPRAVRELLALQSSDWAFAVQQDQAVDYGHARAAGHAEDLATELASLGSSAPELRNLAPFATVAPLLA
jgi:1,4-alpha-glucan branching enzyme